MQTLSGFFSVEGFVLGMLGLSLVLAFIRLLLGPSSSDRVVALDMIAVTSVAVIVVYTVFVNETAFLDAAIIVALIGFLGTIAFARYLERRAQHD
jgi:multicomponent Na+:H+ antiporter subunit F